MKRQISPWPWGSWGSILIWSTYGLRRHPQGRKLRISERLSLSGKSGQILIPLLTIGSLTCTTPLIKTSSYYKSTYSLFKHFVRQSSKTKPLLNSMKCPKPSFTGSSTLTRFFIESTTQPNQFTTPFRMNTISKLWLPSLNLNIRGRSSFCHCYYKRSTIRMCIRK